MMTGNRATDVPTGLMAIVAVLVVVVLGLGGVIVFLQLQPDGAPQTSADRDLMLWEQIVDDNPSEAWAHTGLGLAELGKGNRPAAREAFEMALELNPEGWSAMLELGKMDMDTSPSRAADLLEKAGSLAPRKEKAAAYLALGDLLLAEGDPEGARTAFETSIADLPFIFASQFGLAQALEELGLTDQAVLQYQRARDFDPSNPDVRDALERLDAEDNPTDSP